MLRLAGKGGLVSLGFVEVAVPVDGGLTCLAHGAVGTIEFEPGLTSDLPSLLHRLIPPSRDYGHEKAWHDGNGHSHLQATLLGQGLTVPVSEGKLLLGVWQQIFHLECDSKPDSAKSSLRC